MDKLTLENYNRWLNSSVISDEDKASLKKMSDNEIDDAFFKNIRMSESASHPLFSLHYLSVHTPSTHFAGYSLPYPSPPLP